nr:MAG TPA: hypothetical protein [Caudoviricetes sp.]
MNSTREDIDRICKVIFFLFLLTLLGLFTLI